MVRCVQIALFTAFTVFTSLFVVVTGHGMLIDPPGRSTAWRFGFNTPINYNDNALFCGGFVAQWRVNDGKCGICGDAYNAERKHELPDGKFTKNLVVTRKYTRGSIFTATAQLTANHKGYFIFKICPATTRSVEVTQECLDSNVVEVLNSKDKYAYYLPSDKSGNFTVDLKLPDDLICERCVLQWHYTAGNNWGVCEDGSSSIGCGRQENFKNCADIEITPHENDVDGEVSYYNPENNSGIKPEGGAEVPRTYTQKPNDSKTTRKSILTSTLCPKTSTEARVTFKKSQGKGTSFWSAWTPKSRSNPTFKPHERMPTHTTYSTTEMNSITTATRSSTNNFNSGTKKCVGIGAFEKNAEMAFWCQMMCKTNICPESHCHCY